MINPIEAAIPVTYTNQRTYTEVVSGKEPGDKKYVETSYDTVVYDKNGQLDQVTRVHKVNYYA